jgi:hypothetical protein
MDSSVPSVGPEASGATLRLSQAEAQATVSRRPAIRFTRRDV